MKKIFLFIFIYLFLISNQTVFAQYYTVKEVKTADRIQLTNGEGIRLIGIDVPEARNNSRAAKQAEKLGVTVDEVNELGMIANIYVKALIEGKEVLIEFDAQKDDGSGQLYAYLFFEAAEEDREEDYVKGVMTSKEGKKYIFLNALLIDLGYAVLDHKNQNVRYQYLFNQIHKAVANKESLNTFKNLSVGNSDEDRLFYKF